MTTSHQRILAKYLQWANSPAGRAALMPRPPVIPYVLAGVLCLTVVAAPVGIGLAIGTALRRSRHRRQYSDFLQLAARCRPITAYPLMVNRAALRTPGAVAPGLVIGSFDPRADHTFMSEIGLRIFAASGLDDGSMLSTLMDDERFVRHRRRLLPLDQTDQIPVFAFDLMITGNHLPAGKVEGIIPCLADPESKPIPNSPDTYQGAIFTIPWQIGASVMDWPLLVNPELSSAES
jgi:hypothetical protein